MKLVRFGDANRGIAMILKSTAFEEGMKIAAKYTCDGANFSPPLKWSDSPKKTVSFSLICDDPDAPAGTWVHWVLYDLPAAVTELPEHVPADNKLSAGGTHGSNDFGNTGYGGPCPPRGTHRYYFKLYALDNMLGLEPGATKQQVLDAMKGHVLAETQLMGRYRR